MSFADILTDGLDVNIKSVIKHFEKKEKESEGKDNDDSGDQRHQDKDSLERKG